MQIPFWHRSGDNLVVSDFVHGTGDRVLNGFPLYLFKEGDDRNGNIGQHKDGEGKEVYHSSCRTAVDLLPLGNGRDGAQNKEHAVEVQKSLP